MKDTNNFIETVVQLMRLTRENKIKWKRSGENNGIGYSYSGHLNELEFELKEVLFPDPKDFDIKEVLSPLYPFDYLSKSLSGFWYRLTIKDSSTSEEIVFPFSQAVNDLGAIVASKSDKSKVLNSINERLKAL